MSAFLDTASDERLRAVSRDETDSENGKGLDETVHNICEHTSMTYNIGVSLADDVFGARFLRTRGSTRAREFERASERKAVEERVWGGCGVRE